MGALADTLLEAANGNVALTLALIGLLGSNVWQTRHFDKRLEGIGDRVAKTEERIKRTETYLMGEPEAVRADGGGRSDIEPDLEVAYCEVEQCDREQPASELENEGGA